MNRRELLSMGGVAVSFSGCLQSWRGGGQSPRGERSVAVVSQADQPAVPVEYGVETVTPTATVERPARIRVTITNPTDETVVLGEERAVQFHHVSSSETTLYLYPAADGMGPVDPGCWRLTDSVAVAEYYGTVELEGGETKQAESYVYGHHALPADVCLPAGEHRIRTSGVAGDDGSVPGGSSATEFVWGFTLRIDE